MQRRRAYRGTSSASCALPHGAGAPAAVLVACALLGACGQGHASSEELTWTLAPAGDEAPATEDYQVPPPPLSEETYPCSDCHDPELPVNTRRRELQLAHDDIVLNHAEGQRWCLDCHDATDRDQLHLASGEPVAFEESHRLCGQCHGDKYRDWRAGVHGRRTGSWSGEKSYLLCVHCHDSHDPAFRPLQPKPPPLRPERTP